MNTKRIMMACTSILMLVVAMAFLYIQLPFVDGEESLSISLLLILVSVTSLTYAILDYSSQKPKFFWSGLIAGGSILCILLLVAVYRDINDRTGEFIVNSILPSASISLLLMAIGVISAMLMKMFKQNK